MLWNLWYLKRKKYQLDTARLTEYFITEACRILFTIIHEHYLITKLVIKLEQHSDKKVIKKAETTLGSFNSV